MSHDSDKTASDQPGAIQFNELEHRDIEYLDKKLLSLTHDFLKAELHARISEQLKIFGIDLTPEERDFETLATAVERRSLAELYMIVWQVAKNLSTSDLRFYSLSQTPGGLAGQVEKLCLEILDGYESKNRPIKPFDDRNKSRSSLSLVLFDSFFGVKSDYYMKSLRQIWNHYA